MPTNLLIIGKRNKNRTKVATINVRYDVDDGPRNINYINDCIQSGILNRSKIDFQSPSLPSSSPVLIDLRSGVRPSVQVCGRSREGNDEPNDINGHFDTNLSDTWYKNRKMDIRTTSTWFAQINISIELNSRDRIPRPIHCLIPSTWRKYLISDWPLMLDAQMNAGQKERRVSVATWFLHQCNAPPSTQA